MHAFHAVFLYSVSNHIHFALVWDHICEKLMSVHVLPYLSNLISSVVIHVAGYLIQSPIFHLPAL